MPLQPVREIAFQTPFFDYLRRFNEFNETHTMKTQSFKSHTQWVPTYHFATFALLLACLVISVLMFFDMSGCPWLLPTWMVLSTLSLISVAFHARSFALKVQDRAIRAEESLRHYILTGKPLDARLEPLQIVALRFASDDEFPALALRAAEQGIKPDDIKKQVKYWREDTYRV